MITKRIGCPARINFSAWLSPTHLSREPARHRSVPALALFAALALGNSRRGIAQHAGPCQRASAMADVRRSGLASLRGRFLWRRVGPDRLCPRRHDGRSLPERVSVGAFSLDQGGDQNQRAARFARSDSDHDPRHAWRHSRGDLARRADFRAGGGLYSWTGAISISPVFIASSILERFLSFAPSVALSWRDFTRVRSTSPPACAATRPCARRAPPQIGRAHV